MNRAFSRALAAYALLAAASAPLPASTLEEESIRAAVAGRRFLVLVKVPRGTVEYVPDSTGSADQCRWISYTADGSVFTSACEAVHRKFEQIGAVRIERVGVVNGRTKV